MRSHLQKGAGFGLNLFEPRYRWLAQRIDHGTGNGTLRFCYATSSPQVGTVAWITRMDNLQWTPDGCARFVAVPEAKCRLLDVWTEQVPDNPRAPPLMCCDCEELPEEEETELQRAENEENRQRSYEMSLPQLVTELLRLYAQGDRSPPVLGLINALGILQEASDDEDEQDQDGDHRDNTDTDTDMNVS